MSPTARIAACSSASFAIILLMSTLESSSPQPLQPIAISIVLTAVVAGFMASSAMLAAFGTLIGGAVALVLGAVWGVKLYPTSPTPLDTYIIRLMLLGGTALLSSGVGYVSSSIFTKPSQKQVIEVEQPPQLSQETTQSPSMEATPPQPTPHPTMADKRVCKFCGSVIPAESVYCPMCGTKLVEIE